MKTELVQEHVSLELRVKYLKNENLLSVPFEFDIDGAPQVGETIVRKEWADILNVSIELPDGEKDVTYLSIKQILESL